MKRVSTSLFKIAMQAEIYICRSLLFIYYIFHFGITENFRIPLVCNVRSYVIMFSSSRKAIDVFSSLSNLFSCSQRSVVSVQNLMIRYLSLKFLLT